MEKASFSSKTPDKNASSEKQRSKKRTKKENDDQLTGIPKRFQRLMRTMTDIKAGKPKPRKSDESTDKMAVARKRKPGESMVEYEQRITAICNEAINGSKGIRAKRKE